MANFYEILGVSRTATIAEVRKAYALLAREKHPDRFPDPAQKERAHHDFQLITEAFNTLSNDKSRREYDDGLARPSRPMTPEEIAGQTYERGMAAFQSNDFFGAVELFRTSLNHVPDDPRVLAALGRALVKNPHWVREGVQSLEKAAQLAPRHAPIHAELAEVLLGQNLRLRARRAAETALRLDPGNEAARRVLQAAGEGEPGAEPPPSGGLRGLLRRKP
ncbi:MAG TPA: J domain-containing protein [Vicinamibacteria bacterium]|nr:J domain-containing protein [Vicinamibacteria bacterium]